MADSVRSFKITINDYNWSSPEVRAKALRDIGIAQIGSRGVVDDKEFVSRLSKRLIGKLIPALFRELFTHDKNLLACADVCEKECSYAAANAAACAALAADAAACAALAAYYAAACAARAADAAARAAYYAAAYAAALTAARAAAAAANAGEKYLIMAVNIALDILRELKSPGCAYI